jgi:hypothetical protein
MLVLFTTYATGQKTTTSNVTTVIHDYDTAGNSLLSRSDDYNGNGEATYTSNSSGRSSLVSTIVDGTDWELELQNQSQRSLYITPNDPVGAQLSAPQAGLYSAGTFARVHCFDQYGNLVPLANVVTYSGNCTFGVDFTSGSFNYKLLMSPFPFTEGGSAPPTCPPAGCPATGVVTVTCNGVNSNSQCVSWTFAPNSTAANVNVANLYKYQSTRGGSATWVYIGQYYNSFRMDVTNP